VLQQPFFKVLFRVLFRAAFFRLLFQAAFQSAFQGAIGSKWVYTIVGRQEVREKLTKTIATRNIRMRLVWGGWGGASPALRQLGKTIGPSASSVGSSWTHGPGDTQRTGQLGARASGWVEGPADV
jgi:hypothetical protein